MPIPLDAGDLWLGVAGIAAWTVLMCLRTISFAVENAIVIHTLAIETRRLREEQLRRIEGIRAAASPRIADPRRAVALRPSPGATRTSAGRAAA